MTKNHLIYGGIGIIVLAGGAFIFLNNNQAPKIEYKQSTNNRNNTSNKNNTSINNQDLFANSSLPQAKIDELKKNNPELIQQLQNSYQNKPISQGNSAITFVPVEQEQIQQYTPQKTQPIDYSKFNVVSVDPNENNRKLNQLKIESERKAKDRLKEQQQEYTKMYNEFSNPGFGNDIEVPKEQLLFFRDIKQQEFEQLMITLNKILPTHPNKAQLEKQIVQYKDYYVKLQNSIDNNNVTYGMLLQHDAQHKKIVQQVQQIHQSFIGYTNNLYKNQFLKEETDAEYDKKNGITNNSNKVNSVPPNPSALNYKTQVPPNPSALPKNNAQTSGSQNLTPSQNPTGNAFR